MANPNVDSDFSRGFYQHRRTYSATVNGDGAPLATDLLEGEIAINLTTSKLYTKKNTFQDIDYTDKIETFQQNAGVLLDFSPISSAYIGQKVGINFNNGTKSFIFIDSDDTTVSNWVNDFVTHVAANHPTTSVINGTALGQFGKTSQVLVFTDDSDQALSYDLDSDFVRYIDHTRTTVSRLIQSSDSDNDIFAKQGTVTPTSFIKTYKTVGSVKSITSTSVPLRKFVSGSENSYFVTNLTLATGGINEGTDQFRVSIDQNNPSILDLTARIPTTSNTPPAVAATSSKPGLNGDLWIQPPGAENDSEPSHLYWLDMSVVNSTNAQAKARAMSDSDRISQGVVLVDSDGSGGSTFAEWRQVTSGSFLITQNFGTVSETKTFDSDSIHTMLGTLDVSNGVLKAGSRFEFQNDMFTKTKRLRIKNVSGSTVFSMVGFDSDG
jgi:hypothetical protein